jgi:hypothetical protein
MSVSTDIKKQLVTSINALSTTQAVYGYEELDPNGWPAVWVTTSNLNGTFVTTTENRRVYGFNVMCLFPLGEDFIKDGSIQRVEYAENTLNDVVDQIINLIDDKTFITTLNNIYSAGDSTVLFVEASDAQWGTVDMQKGKAKGVQVTLLIHTDYNVTT